MKKTLNQFWMRIVPFFAMGIFLVLLVAGLIIFSYLLIFGAIAGLILFVIFWVYSKLTDRKTPAPTQTRSGRTIDHNKDY